MFSVSATYKFIQTNNNPLSITNSFIYIEPLNSFFRTKHNVNGEKKDWSDYKFLEEESRREGPGEMVSKFFLRVITTFDP